MKKAGICIDTYKLKTFKSALEKGGFKNYKVSDFSPGVKFITVEVEDGQVGKLTKLLREIEIKLKMSN